MKLEAEIRDCPHCGATPSSSTARFCGKCGKPLDPPRAAEGRVPEARSAEGRAPVRPGPPRTATPPTISSRQPSTPAHQLPASAHHLWTWLRRSKPRWFSVNGALGCLLGALLGELILALFLPAPPPPLPPAPPVDVVFVLDVTGSMQEELDGVRDGIVDFAAQFGERNLNVREGLIAFGDRLNGEEPVVLSFGEEPFTSEAESFREQVGNVQMVEGGDEPESSLDALSLAASQPFRPSAKKVIILITDAQPQVPDKETATAEDVTNVLRAAHIDQLHLVVQDADLPVYQPLQAAATNSGLSFSLAEAASGRQEFERLLPEIGAQIAATIGGVSSSRRFSEQSFWQVVFTYALWTSLLAAGVALSLIIGQNLYMRGRGITATQLLPVAMGSIAVGMVAGSAGQILFARGGAGPLSRLVAWAILGALVGWGVSLFVPNLDRRKAMQGGAVGGAAGAVAFIVLSAGLGDLSGRLLGAAILGGCIGLMIALIEAASRKVWLEVSGGTRETWQVTLGDEVVDVGSNELCKVYVPELAPLALRYRVEQGRVLCEDVLHNTATEIRPDEPHEMGSVSLTLRTSAERPIESA